MNGAGVRFSTRKGMEDITKHYCLADCRCHSRLTRDFFGSTALSAAVAAFAIRVWRYARRLCGDAAGGPQRALSSARLAWRSGNVSSGQIGFLTATFFRRHAGAACSAPAGIEAGALLITCSSTIVILAVAVAICPLRGPRFAIAPSPVLPV
jgi:hypothetical protein